MVEVYVVLTLFSTIIAVTMATLFFCCWRKKGSKDIADEKSSSTKEELKKERSASTTPADVAVPENGAQKENISPPVLLVSSPEEDLGDFSAVQRETEILRSYRKPLPPKNRAPQTRTPRQHKNDSESNDIFAELSEEDGKNEINSEMMNIVTEQASDSVQLRCYSEGQEKPTRDARSSMLADIEETIATLHISEQSTDLLSGNDSLSEDKTKFTDSALKESNTIEDDNSLTADKSDFQTNNLTIHESKSSLSQTLISTEEASITHLIESPKSADKQKPKVSPKPSPRNSERVSTVDNSTTHSIEKLTNNGESNFYNSTVENTDVVERTVSSVQCLSLHTTAETAGLGMIEEITSGLQTIQKSTEITNSQLQISLDNTGSDVSSIPVDTATLRDNVKSEVTTIKSDSRKTSGNLASDIGDGEDTVAEVNKSIMTNSISERYSENASGQSPYKTVDSDANDTIFKHDLDALTSSTTAADTLVERSTASVQGDGGSLKENVTRRRESTEDQTGKGKTSKIPVRSGSKPKSIP